MDPVNAAGPADRAGAALPAGSAAMAEPATGAPAVAGKPVTQRWSMMPSTSVMPATSAVPGGSAVAAGVAVPGGSAVAAGVAVPGGSAVAAGVAVPGGSAVAAGVAVPGPSAAKCRIREILGRIGDKWSLFVIFRLGDGPQRFTTLKRAVDGISQRMLTVTLRGLERDGIVSRTMYPVMPPRVDYALTPLGHTLLDAVGALMAWVDEHLPEVDAARDAYDARATGADPGVPVPASIGLQHDSRGLLSTRASRQPGLTSPS
jgi:DNA-binding HxlR family transcriptional regulator